MLTGNADESKVKRNAAFALLLPGKVLHLSALIVTRKFRERGNKAGALEAMVQLGNVGLGKLSEVKSARCTDKASDTSRRSYLFVYFCIFIM